MSEVELLRRAASLMRERANAATPGRWEAFEDGLVWDGLIAGKAVRCGDPVSGSTEITDAFHIASWDPAVALAVADLLDTVATEQPDFAPHEELWDPRQGAAVVVARRYLREVE